MGRLILHMITSIDGFISDHDDAVNPETQWDEEMQQFYLDRFTTAEAVVFGRRLYQQYVGHWARVASGEIPPQTGLELRWATRLLDMPKYVVSTSSPDVAANTRILTGDIAAELAERKQKAADGLLLMCGPALLAHLTAARLVDEYMLYVCPSALGAGTHLFRDISDHVKLSYTRSVSFTTGVNLHIYKPVYPPTSASTVFER